MSDRPHRRKAGITLDRETDRLLDALSFVLGMTRSDLVIAGIRAHTRCLPEPQMRSVETAIRLSRERS